MTTSVVEIGQSLKSLPTAELRTILCRCLERSAEELLRMAAIVVELESRGDDLSTLRLSLVPHLRLIATKQLLPETVVHFQGQQAILNWICRLTIAEQRRLIDDPVVPVYVAETDEVESVKIEDLHIRTARSVFGNGRIRTPAEQKHYLLGSNKVADQPKPVERVYRVRADRERDGFMVGQQFVKKADFLVAASDLNGPLEPLRIDDNETESTRVTAAEKEKIKLAERQLGLPAHHLIRMALHAYGII